MRASRKLGDIVRSSIAGLAICVIAGVAGATPIADAGSDQVIKIGDSLWLDGSNSIESDPARVLVEYLWVALGYDFSLSGPTPGLSAAQVDELVNPVAGTVVAFALTVTNDLGEQSLPDTTTVTFVPEPTTALLLAFSLAALALRRRLSA